MEYVGKLPKNRDFIAGISAEITLFRLIFVGKLHGFVKYGMYVQDLKKKWPTLRNSFNYFIYL